MAVRDKELIINGKAVRSPEQQVWQNMKDIEELKENIKPEYTTNASLTSSSVSVALTDTNAPAGTTKGWLLSHDGLKFKITGGDGTNLLLEFYADLKGPQGEDGAALNIDDNSVSQTKVWSSYQTKGYTDSKIDDLAGTNETTWSSNKINSLISSGVAWTTTDIDGDSQIATSAIYLGSIAANDPQFGKPKLKVDDLVIYVDGDLKAKTLYRVSSITSGSATVTKVCDFGGGKQLYKHNIGLSTAAKPSYVSFTIINDVDTPYTSINDIKTYLASLPVVPNYAVNKYIMASGGGLSGSDPLTYYGIIINNNKIYGVCQLGNTSTFGYEVELTTFNSDIVEPI